MLSESKPTWGKTYEHSAHKLAYARLAALAWRRRTLTFLWQKASARGKLRRLSSAVLLRHVAGQVDKAVRVAPLVVIPTDELHEVVAQRDACTYIKDGGGCATDEVPM